MRSFILWGATWMSLLAGSGTALAQDDQMTVVRSSEYVAASGPSLITATDSVVLVKTSAEATAEPAKAEFEPPLISGSNMHKLLGLATVGAAGATFLTHHHDKAPPRARNDTHAKLGKTTAVLAAATVISGLITHWDDFATEDGITDPDNLHVLLGAGGAALMAYAINKSMNSKTPVSHAELAELGAASMILAIKLTW